MQRRRRRRRGRLGFAASVPTCPRPSCRCGAGPCSRMPSTPSRGCARLRSLVVVAPAGSPTPPAPAWAGVDLPPDAVVVAGGASRTDSVAAGLAARRCVDVVLVHDAARCLTPLAVFERVVDAVRRRSGAVPCPASRSSTRSRRSTPPASSPAPRTARRCGPCRRPRGSGARCSSRPTRSGLAATDDAALVELAGHHVRRRRG